MKLILTSEGFRENPDKLIFEMIRLSNKKVDDIKMTLFSISYSELHEYYLNKNIDLLVSLWIKRDNIKMVNICKMCPDNVLSNLDVMYMCGGNTFEVLHYLQTNWFIRYIKEFIEKWWVYFWHSAGSQILGMDIGIAAAGVNWDVNEIWLKDTAWLWYLDYAIWSHYVDEDQSQISKFQKEYKYNFITLKDNESIIIDGNHIKFIY